MNVPPAPGSPWSPSEKLELFCEIAKAANLHPDTMLPLVRSLPQPRWDDMIIPRGTCIFVAPTDSLLREHNLKFAGRTLNQCKAIYHEYMYTREPHPPQFPQPPSTPQAHDTTQIFDFPTRLPPTAEEPAPLSAFAQQPRYPDLQPRPSGFGGPSPVLVEQPKKRRGRPTKAEVESRKELARASAPVMRELVPAPYTSSLAAAQAAQAVMGGPPPQLPLPRAMALPPDVALGKRKRTLSREDGFEQRQGPGAAASASDTALRPTSGRPPPPPQPSRGYPDILLRGDDERPPSFRGPR